MNEFSCEGNPNLRESIRAWLALGGTESKPNSTGEVLLHHPLVGRVRVNCRRKDSPRALVVKLRKLFRLVGGKGAA
ncbi:MAG: hypothetical protein R3F29_03625 [Planctomycetota bacterium]